METNLELETRPATTAANAVVVTDIHMSFGAMVVFMIKAALAAIPAMIILGIIYALIGGVFWSMVMGLF